MGDDTIGTITGKATFQHVSIFREGEKVRVLGTYMGDDTTTYEAPPGSVRIGGLEVMVGDEEAVTVTPTEEDGWVWVTATEEELLITNEEPEDE
ncbi:hypothetical protein M1M18_gp034 [Halorubrum virus Serpecor1]|uniref:Uncharacterized protein n=1 Tax=Halorubrum virus Serpecor1 TaxID=2721757 RepID=A0A6G9RY90_9CAUD|nr:hypothetical protein M1M18_gp034 [Halorubrum virus Serpecor1]QIR31266.1 hypothetical protein HrrSp1_525 [Halorubrum virus Serpecor1]